jgi:hypothetical protein
MCTILNVSFVQGYIPGLQIYGIRDETRPTSRRRKHPRSQCIELHPHTAAYIFASIMMGKALYSRRWPDRPVIVRYACLMVTRIS